MCQGRRLYQDMRWQELPLRHGFGTRGVDAETYLQDAGVVAWQIPLTKQVHGTIAMPLTPPLPQVVLTADAFVTATPGVVCMVRTADCVPILLYEPVRRVVAAVHAGWRGLAAGVIANTMRVMVDRFECTAARVEAAIGPAIRGADFEVDARVCDAMREGGHSVAAAVVRRTGRGVEMRWWLDLPTLAVQALQHMGVAADRIAVAAVSTVTHQADFASYRRDGAGSERQVSWIVLE